MRIIFLNSWFGKVENPFFDFIKEQSSKTDIFCLMEVNPKLFTELEGVLVDFKGVYKKGRTIESLSIGSGQAIFLKKGIDILSSGRVSIYRQSPTDVGFLQFVNASKNGAKFWIGSVHGKAQPGQKLDTPVRINQSAKILQFFKDKEGPKIIGGDFNLMPDTESVKMFEKAGYRNLIRVFEIKETRNRLSWEQFPNNEKQHFADFCFVSPEIKIQNFQVTYNEISDHLPQILDFEI